MDGSGKSRMERGVLWTDGMGWDGYFDFVCFVRVFLVRWWFFFKALQVGRGGFGVWVYRRTWGEGVWIGYFFSLFGKLWLRGVEDGQWMRKRERENKNNKLHPMHLSIFQSYLALNKWWEIFLSHVFCIVGHTRANEREVDTKESEREKRCVKVKRWSHGYISHVPISRWWGREVGGKEVGIIRSHDSKEVVGRRLVGRYLFTWLKIRRKLSEAQ